MTLYSEEQLELFPTGEKRHMKVKLISHSTPTKEMAECGLHDIKDLVAFCARVSNPSNQLNSDTYDKLIKYLLDNKHFSPFELVNATLEIETTRDIARQMLRHRSFTFNEFSQRYSDPISELTDSFVLREARLQDNKNRQNSFPTDDEHVQKQWENIQKRVIDFITNEYLNAKDLDIAKEQRRALLPEGLTVSKMYMSGSIRSWIHYIELRSKPGTQKEHRDIAVECAKVISQVFDVSKYVCTDA